MIHSFIKASGLKSQAEFDKKYPTEDHFFSEFPHLKPKAAMGYTIDANGNKVDENGNITTNDSMLGQGEAMQLNVQPSQAWQVQNENSPETMSSVYNKGQIQPINQPSSQTQSSQGMNAVGMGAMGAARQIGQGISDAVNALPSIITSIAPDNHRVRNKPLDLAYNPFSYGTGSRTMFAEGGVMQGNGLQVEDNAITPMSPSFSRIGGETHANGGTDVSYGGQTVEMQQGEPITKTSDGSLVAFGKMSNPLTGRMFESDAKLLAKEENKISKISSKATNLLETDPTTAQNGLKFNTGSVLQDAANIKLAEVNGKKELFADMQNSILQIAQEENKNPKSLSNKMKMGEDGIVLPKFKEGGKLSKYKQYDPETVKILEDNYDNLLWEGVVPLNTLTGQKTGKNNTFGDAYSTQVDKFNTIRGLQGLSPITNTRAYQDAYNQEFMSNTGKPFFQGDTPAGIDGKMGNKTSSTPFFRGNFQGNKEASLTADQIAKMSDEDFAAISGSNKSDFFKKNNNLGATWQYDFTGGVQDLQPTAIKPLPNNYQPQQLQGVGTQPIDLGQSQEVDRILPNTPRPSLADRNRFNLTSIIPEIAAALDKPDFVQGQQFTPDLLSPYRVSFQDQINQNQSTFSQVERSLRNNPEALSTLAANTYDANNRVQAQEFRTNQEIANQTYNQNTGILNDAKKTNISLQDLQADRQAQAKANTDFNRQNALNSISSKFLQNKAENNKIRLMENFSNYRTDENGTLQNFNDAPVWGSGMPNSGSLDRNLFLKKDGTVDEAAYRNALVRQGELDLKRQKAQQITAIYPKRRR